MAASAPLMPFLRPLGPPRPATIRVFMRSLSITPRCAAEPQQQQVKEDRNLIASRTASPTYPPQSMTSLPRPKISRASRRTAHPPKERLYPIHQRPYEQKQARRLIPEPVTHLPEDQSAPNLAYFVSRTRSNELPVYTDYKRGGNLKLTIVRKVQGQLEALRDALREELKKQVGLDEKRVVVNGLAQQVVIKGTVKDEVVRFLRERRF